MTSFSLKEKFAKPRKQKLEKSKIGKKPIEIITALVGDSKKEN